MGEVYGMGATSPCNKAGKVEKRRGLKKGGSNTKGSARGSPVKKKHRWYVDGERGRTNLIGCSPKRVKCARDQMKQKKP